MLEIKNFTKTYSQNKKAVDNLSLSVMPGEIHGFIGHNGAGKTTTIRAIVGVMDFNDGEILIAGHSIKKEPVKCKSLTAYIPDNPDIYDYITGIQYLSYMADMFSVKKKQREVLIQKYAEVFGITDSLGNLISSYSHGMKQKLALIGAFLHSPKLLVLDEPFVGLDPEAAFHLKEFMRELCNQGSAIFFSTHVLEVAEKLCDKVSIIKQGKMVVSGSMENVRGSDSLENVFMEVVENEK
ncbi:TPA: ABC transporter ATP-binding protein [Clostridioides difficile]|uniref:ABC transporter ATP-binding protein n=1 Tax=Clostridioides difficile TaxID=1496 RepID=UPI001C17ECCB|nr:ABC transporter ATP-binding protein [Clostridioides difficile]MDL0294755.1 ABC transporter ATP-binding protein [Clostridioides difficile]HBE8849562.1 ABC transporter ATP-binding protein [Clostridioides difficile]HDF3138376.1 ABC transporter ATP-binding protein [Clostridioides difficile]